MSDPFDKEPISGLVVMDAAKFSESGPVVRPGARRAKIGVLALQGAFKEHVALLKACGADAVEVRKEAELDACDGLVLPGGESTAMTLIAQRTGMWEPLKRWLSTTSKPTWGTCAGMILLADRATGTKSGGQPLLGGLDVTVHRNYFGSQASSFESPILVSDDVRAGLGVSASEKLPGVFIRAPAVLSVGPSATPIATVKARSGDASTPAWAQGKGLEAGMDRVEAVAAKAGVGAGTIGGAGDAAGSASGAAGSGAASFPSGLDSSDIVVGVRQGDRFLATAFHPELTSHLGWHRMFVNMVEDHVSKAPGAAAAAKVPSGPESAAAASAGGGD